MSGGENIRRLLAETGIYTLTGDTPVDQEVSAYGAGLSRLEEKAAALEADLFALTATDAGLSQWEKLYLGYSCGGTLEARRRAAAEALSCRGGPVTAENLPGLILAAGIRGDVQEKEDSLIISVRSYEGTTEAGARKLLKRLLPAHLLWELVPADGEA